MATATTPSSHDHQHSITVELPAHVDAASDEVQHGNSNDTQKSESSAERQRVKKKLENLNKIVFFIAFFDWAGNAIGTLSFLWATVVLLGGFCSLLSRKDFWFATVMVFTEGSRVFIRNDSSVNQWLLGSTSAFRWEDVSSPRNLLPPTPGKIIAVVIAVGIAVTPLEFRHVIVEGILKVALLVTISLLLTRVRRGWFAGTVLCLLLTLAVIGALYAYVKVAIIDNIKRNGWGSHRKAILRGNPFFLYCLERVLELEGSEPKLWEPVMNIIAVLALDKASREEIGSTQCIIPKLMHAFLMPDDAKPGENNAPSLRMAAVEALANLTIMSTDNCWAVLLADPKHNLIKNLINMLEDKHAANLLHNLCVNLGDKLIEHGSSDEDMKSALVKVIEIIQTNMEGEKLEAALCIASKIGCVIPQHFVQLLESDTNAAAAEALVENLVNTLKSNREPSLERPRIRRVLIEVIMSIVNLCHTYRKIFREKGAKDALDMIKGTPSRLEKYSVFLRGEGVVVESLPMSDLVDEAKRLIDPETPTPGAQPVDHA
ncbi:unnamed protein product [Urochloa humidicola]